jgi:hypothetical protein
MSEMMNDMIERYLDNLMTPQERAEFERRLAQDAGLATQIARQRDVDASLRRLLAVPSASAAAQMVARIAGEDVPSASTAASSPVAGRIGLSSTAPFTKWLAAAAIIAIVLGSAWFVWDRVKPLERELVVHAAQSPAEYYHMKVGSGFKPSWKCENDAEFAASFNTQFGQPLLLRALPAGVAAGGIDYCNTLTPKSVGLLGSVNDQKVIVIVDKLTNDKPLDVPPGSGLHLFRREVGNLVAYEVTPLDHSSVVEHLYVPERVPPPPGVREDSGATNG